MGRREKIQWSKTSLNLSFSGSDNVREFWPQNERRR